MKNVLIGLSLAFGLILSFETSNPAPLGLDTAGVSVNVGFGNRGYYGPRYNRGYYGPGYYSGYTYVPYYYSSPAYYYGPNYNDSYYYRPYYNHWQHWRY